MKRPLQIISKLKTGLKVSWDATRLFFSWKVAWPFYLFWVLLILDGFIDFLPAIIHIPNSGFINSLYGEYVDLSVLILWFGLLMAIGIKMCFSSAKEDKVNLLIYLVHALCALFVGSVLYHMSEDFLFALAVG